MEHLLAATDHAEPKVSLRDQTRLEAERHPNLDAQKMPDLQNDILDE